MQILNDVIINVDENSLLLHPGCLGSEITQWNNDIVLTSLEKISELIAGFDKNWMKTILLNHPSI